MIDFYILIFITNFAFGDCLSTVSQLSLNYFSIVFQLSLNCLLIAFWLPFDYQSDPLGFLGFILQIYQLHPQPLKLYFHRYAVYQLLLNLHFLTSAAFQLLIKLHFLTSAAFQLYLKLCSPQYTMNQKHPHSGDRH